MRKSQLKRLKKDAENAYEALGRAKRRPQLIRNRFEALPERIEDAARWVEKQETDDARERAQRWLHELRTEYDAGSEGRIAEAEEKLVEAQREFDDVVHTLCTYAVFYARQRRDIDLVWTSEDEGQWTLDGHIAGLFDGEARKITVKALILYLIEPHSHRTNDSVSVDDDEWQREVKAKERDANTFSLYAQDLYKAMTGLPTNAYVDVEGCTVKVRRLRQYLRLCGDVLTIRLPDAEIEVNEGAEHAWGYREAIHTEARPEGMRAHRATWKHVLQYPEAHIALAA